ncbi:TPA: hypothetical protein ACP4TE_004847, partial [Escherichia coli]
SRQPENYRLFFYLSKPEQTRAPHGLSHQKQPAIYILYYQDKGTPPDFDPRSHLQSSKNQNPQNRLSGRWLTL